MAKSKKRKTARAHRTKVLPPVKPVVPESLKKYASELGLAEVRKQPRLLALVFCDFASKTDDLKMNLLGVFDRINVHPDHLMSPQFVVYGRTAESSDQPLFLRIFDPDNEPQAEVRFDNHTQHEFLGKQEPGTPKQIQFVIPLVLKLRKQGTYWFDVAYGDVSLGGAGLVVKQVTTGGDGGTDTFT